MAGAEGKSFIAATILSRTAACGSSAAQRAGAAAKTTRTRADRDKYRVIVCRDKYSPPRLGGKHRRVFGVASWPLDCVFSPGGPSRVVAAGSRPDHPEARGRSKSQERGGPGPHAKPDGQILVFWIIAFNEAFLSAAFGAPLVLDETRCLPEFTTIINISERQ